jgi:hypothetical protein
MEYTRILRRAFEITKSYRALWIFGLLLALTTSLRGNGSNGGGGGGGGGSASAGGFIPPGEWHLPAAAPGWEVWLAAGLALIFLVVGLVVISVVVRYVAETALIRMVDREEAVGERVSIRQGFRLGWSRPALRLFLIDLLIGLAGLFVFLLLLLVAAAPFLVWLGRSETAQAIGTATGVGLILAVVLFAILVAIVVSLLIQFVRRACVLEELGVIDSIGRGWAMVRQRFWEVLVMGILLFGVSILSALVLIPALLLLVAAGAVLGGLPGLAVGWITSQFFQGAAPWITGIATGLPIFLVVVILPAAFLGGLFEVFKSSAWTLAYREARQLNAVPAGD